MKKIDRNTNGIHGLIALRLMLMVLLSVSAIAPMIAQQELILKDSLGIGSTGSGDGEFDQPQKVAIASDGSIFVVDRSNNRIQKFDKDGNYLSQFGTAGSGNGEFNLPSGMAIDSQGNFFISDRSNHRVQKFDKDGNFIKVIGTTTASSNDGDFDEPSGIAIDAADNVYVVDQSNDRIQKLTNDGTFVKVIGSSGVGNGEFDNPFIVAIDEDANLIVTDNGNNNVQKFDSSGVFVSVIAPYGTGDGNVSNPVGVAFDPQGNLYITDSGTDSVQVFDDNGNFLKKYATPIDQGNKSESFMTFDSNGTLYISDGLRDAVYIYTTVQEINLKQGTADVASGSTVDFGDVGVGTTSTLSFTIENLGGFDLDFSGNTGSQVELSGDNTTDFTVTQTNVIDSLVGFSAVTFTVSYTPAVLGSSTATLTINSNDEDEGTYTVDLTGIAVAADNGDDNEDDNPLSTANENKIGIYPNPAVEVVSIADASVKYAVVYNLMGAKVYAAELENGTLNVKSLRKGLYVLTLMDGVGNILSTNRLMKE